MSHAPLAPSASHRWMNCPGSVAACKDIPSTDSVYAQEGTFAHEIAAEMLRNGSQASAAIGRQSADGQFTVDATMATYIQIYLDAVRSVVLTSLGDVEMLVERKVKVSPKVYGTLDLGLVVRDAGDRRSTQGRVVEIHIADLKYGQGVFVPVEDNNQLKVYVLGLLAEIGQAPQLVDRIVAHIVQPRFVTADPHRSVELTAQELVEFRAKVAAAEMATEQPNAPLVAGDWCRFCPAKSTCPALRDAAMLTVSDVFPMLDPQQLPVAPPDLSQMPADQLARVLDGAEVAEQWIEAVRDHALKRASAGEQIPGRKLVERFGHRKWTDESTAATALQSLGVDPWAPRELLSPNQVEKKSKALKSVVSQLTTKPVIGIALVPSRDRRPEIPADPARLVTDSFSDLGE